MNTEHLCDLIMGFETEYYHEMMAEGAWSGHAYATEYFGDLRMRVLKFCKDVEMHFPENVSWTEKAKSAASELKTDYDALIIKVAGSGLEEWDRYQISDAINTLFEEKLFKAMNILTELYVDVSGCSFDDYEEIFEMQL